VKRFLTLSRAGHAALDLATPAFCALLWNGGYLPLSTTFVALITGLSGYIGVYAINDLMGYRLDSKKIAHAAPHAGYAIESGSQRHPLAQGHITFRAGVAWATAWLAISALGSALLNPTILFVLAVAIAGEVLYCRLFTVTHWRFILSGIVKAAGPVAAVLVVDPAPALPLLLLLFLWVFLWELGGQNIPADWHDQSEDARVNGKTIPLVLGEAAARRIILICAAGATSLAGLMIVTLAPQLTYQTPIVFAVLLAGVLLFLRPAWMLYRAHPVLKEPGYLFHWASFYPAALLAIISAVIVIIT